MSYQASSSKILEGLPRAHWFTTGCLCFVGSMVSAMRYLGEEVGIDYLMGVSGGAFKMYWLPPWAPSNCDLLMIGEEPVRRTFAAMGYEYTSTSDMDRRLPRDFYRDRIIASIDRGVPILADGVVGPPEICVVAGYERGGDALLGWSYFQEDEKSYFRAEDWYSNIFGLIEIGSKKETPAPAQVLRDTLEWAIKLTREPEFDGVMAENEPNGRHFSGLAAYDAMARQLRDDREFTELDAAALELRCTAISNDGVYLLACQREAAARFLRTMAKQVTPVAGALTGAAEAYEEEARTLQEASKLCPLSFASYQEQSQLLDHDYRMTLADNVCEARLLNERAAEYLEAALAACKGA